MSFEHRDAPLADDEALRLTHVGKRYRIYDKPQHRLWQVFRRDRQWFREFLALDDVTFSVKRGEVLGIVGRNGSGKSTLLQIISGILRPTSGSLAVHGRVAALLELGAGFNPEFSGIENVFLNGAILGLERDEIERRLPAILEFADIGDFVHRPVKTYSSGMFVRLAFSVAACVEPDLLVIDEALAVGDVQFQSKCFRRFDELVKSGKTILFVSHSTEQVVRHCTRALLIEGGRLLEDGEPRTVANRYLDLLLGADTRRAPLDRRPRLRSAGPAASGAGAADSDAGAADSDAGVGVGVGVDTGAQERAHAQPATAAATHDDAPGHVLEERAGYCRTEYRWGGGGAELYDAELLAAGAAGHGTRLQAGETATIRVRARFERDCERAIIGFFVKTPDGVTVYGNNTRNLVVQPLIRRSGEELAVAFDIETHLGLGSYLLSLGVAEERNGEVVPLDRRYDVLQFEVIGSPGAVGLTQLYATCRVST